MKKINNSKFVTILKYIQKTFIKIKFYSADLYKQITINKIRLNEEK